MHAQGLIAARTFLVRTLGCQMNAHDSERMAGLLIRAGYRPVDEAHEADVVVINTCAVRENADNRLYGNLGQLRELKERRPGAVIAVGGCLAQKDQVELLRRASWVDVAFGTHNVGALPHLLDRRLVTGEPQVEFRDKLDGFPSDLPTSRSSPFSAWVSISVGCNNTCTYCIVPSLRGKQRDRRPDDVLAEIEALAGEGVAEITLLGQNVNSYGIEEGDREGFSKLLRACGQVDGLMRVRFASPHPRDFGDDVIGAMAETPNVMPHIHLPLQSGSDSVLARMRRSYRSHRYLDLVGRIRQAIPGVAITTDVIVGFPGETDEEFERTLEIVRGARFAGAFTFKYSPRPGTHAAGLPDQVHPVVAAERYERLVALVDEIAWAEGSKLVGKETEVLITGLTGKKDAALGRMSARSPDNRLVHVSAASGVRPGDMAVVEVTRAAPHHLISDGPVVAVTATRGGDAWERAQAASREADGSRSALGAGPRPVDLGIPIVRGTVGA